MEFLYRKLRILIVPRSIRAHHVLASFIVASFSLANPAYGGDKVEDEPGGRYHECTTTDV
jgi:hypothetical protein